MIAGIFLVTAVLVMAAQVMDASASGSRTSITIASQFNIPADRAFTDWPVIGPLLHFLANDIQVWVLLALAAAVIYWVADWTNEKLSVLCRRAPPAAEPKPEYP